MGDYNNCKDVEGFPVVFLKDDTNILEQIGFTILAAITGWLLWKSISNMQHLYKMRREKKCRKLIGMNVLILILNILHMIFFFDGTVALFNSDGMISIRTYYLVIYTGIALFQVAFAMSYNNWSPLLAIAYEKDKKTAKNISRIIFYTVTVIALGEITWLGFLFIATKDICHTLQYEEFGIYLTPSRGNNGLDIAISLLMTSFLVNNIIFSYACYIMAQKIQSIYEFREHKSIKTMKILAGVTIFGTCFRVFHNLVQFTGFYLFETMEKNANDPANADDLGKQFPWVLMNLFYEISCSLAPLAFLLFTFSPNVKRRRRSSGEKSSKTASLLSGKEQQSSTGTTGTGTTQREVEEQHENIQQA